MDIKKLIREKELLETELKNKEQNTLKKEYELKLEEAEIYTETDWKDPEHKKYSNKELKEAYVTKKLNEKRLNNEMNKLKIKQIKREIENKKFLIKYILKNNDEIGGE